MLRTSSWNDGKQALAFSAFKSEETSRGSADYDSPATDPRHFEEDADDGNIRIRMEENTKPFRMLGADNRVSKDELLLSGGNLS